MLRESGPRADLCAHQSDAQMARLRSNLVEEAASIKKSEQARKQRELKKYGKEIQHEKLKQRLQDKKGLDERLRGVKRKRKDGAEIGGDDDGDFDVALDDAIEGKSGKAGKDSRGGKDPRVRIAAGVLSAPLIPTSRCHVMHETPSTGWAVVASAARRTRVNPRTISTSKRARADPEVPRAPKVNPIAPASRGVTTGDESEESSVYQVARSGSFVLYRYSSSDVYHSSDVLHFIF